MKRLDDKYNEKKKGILDSYYKEYTGTEILNLVAPTREEPPEGFPILEVTQKKLDGLPLKWVSYPIGIKNYGIEKINLRRVLPDEIVLDCDECEPEEIESDLIKWNIPFTRWATNSKLSQPHFRFRIEGLEKFKPYERQAIKEQLIGEFRDKDYKCPDLCTAQPCRMVSLEWSKHHKRPEYLELIKDKSNEGENFKIPMEKMRDIIERNKQTIKRKEMGKDGCFSGLVVKGWECPALDKLINSGRQTDGGHRGAIAVAAMLKNKGYTENQALEEMKKWNEKNSGRAKQRDSQLEDQLNMVYGGKGGGFVTCRFMQANGNPPFCQIKEEDCDAAKKNRENFIKVKFKIPVQHQKDIEGKIIDKNGKIIAEGPIKKIILPKAGNPISEFSMEIGKYFSDKNLIFFRPRDNIVVVIDSIPIISEQEQKIIGFRELKAEEFATTIPRESPSASTRSSGSSPSRPASTND